MVDIGKRKELKWKIEIKNYTIVPWHCPTLELRHNTKRGKQPTRRWIYVADEYLLPKQTGLYPEFIFILTTVKIIQKKKKKNFRFESSFYLVLKCYTFNLQVLNFVSI